MTAPQVTDADLVIPGLLAEQPRHGYDLEAVIQQRGIRAWTSLAFSSIYFVLNRLEARGLVRSERESYVTGHPGSPPGEESLAAARYQGRRLAGVAALLEAGRAP